MFGSGPLAGAVEDVDPTPDPVAVVTFMAVWRKVGLGGEYESKTSHVIEFVQASNVSNFGNI